MKLPKFKVFILSFLILIMPFLVYAKNLEKNVLPSLESYEDLKKVLDSSKKVKPFNKVAFPEVKYQSEIKLNKDDVADVAKTDGEYIYYIKNASVFIVRAYPLNKMDVVEVLNYDATSFYPKDIYVYKDNLIVVGKRHVKINKGTKLKPIILSRPMTKVFIYDIADKINIKLKRTIEIDGDYSALKMVDSRFYIITNKYIYDYSTNLDIKPKFSDSTYKKGIAGEIDFKDIKYFQGHVEPNVVLVASFNVLNQEKLDIKAFLGNPNIYISSDSIYFVVSNEGNTNIYKFKMSNGLYYIGSEAVLGNPLYVSMDEYDGCFRIATDKAIYILDENMQIKSKIDLLQSKDLSLIKFIKNKVFIVFKDKAPLVVDISNPNDIKVDGYLKADFSPDVYPIDENQFICFNLNNDIKVSLINANNVEDSKGYLQIIGDNEHYLKVLPNLVFKKDKLIALPIALYKNQNELVYQGIYVYSIEDNRMVLKGVVTHPNKFINRVLYINGTLYTISDDLIKAIDDNTFEELNKLELN